MLPIKVIYMKNNEINKVKEQIRFGKGENNRNSLKLANIENCLFGLVINNNKGREKTGCGGRQRT